MTLRAGTLRSGNWPMLQHAPAAFAPNQRIWWIYLRNAAGTWLEGNEDADVRRAFDGLKAFPENLPGEPRRWHELRQAVAAVLDGLDDD